MKTLLKVSLRQAAIFIPATAIVSGEKKLLPTTSLLAANLSKLGYSVTEPLLRMLNRTSIPFQKAVLEIFREVMGINKNWTPLVKGWDVPTNETRTDHIVTFFTNVFQGKGTALPCGHIIPANTFPLDRYNGCPFCGTPFETSTIKYYKQGSQTKLLTLWTNEDVQQFFESLLISKTALDATQIDSLKLLLAELPLPNVTIAMKETLMAVIDAFVSGGQPEKAMPLFTSPTDIMRYLWYRQTGFLQIIEPKKITKRQAKNNTHFRSTLNTSVAAKVLTKATLKLKYNRPQCAMVAMWMNSLPQNAEKICEMMHPKRSMWVRFIRTLRLAEYSKHKGYDKLKEVLDLFYNQLYEVWQGRVDFYRLRLDAENTFGMLKQRPGLFARSLFANMLWFGTEDTVAAFAEVAPKVPARLLFTLNMYAANYFSKDVTRSVKPLGGVNKQIPANPLVDLYDDKQLGAMQSAITQLCIGVVKSRFAAAPPTAASMYIHPALYNMPVSIGDRSDNVQDMPSALMGTRFPVEGDAVRLFMQWGTGLRAQHLDMDLSCKVAYPYKTDFCSYSQKTMTGCQHSGDVINIPDKVGTAEYIELNLPTLQKAGALYVSFTCNAYSNGSITPNLVVGWMNSRYPMKISAQPGVAYDPSCVQHQVRITNSLAKGLVFGVLDVPAAEIVWLEMPFSGQVVQNLDTQNIRALLKKLTSKLTIGQLLAVKAEAQGMQVISTADADEIYTDEWGRNTAAVTQLLVD
jgi:hypothetical protein